MVQTTLHYACRDGDLDLVKNIVEGRNGHVSFDFAKKILSVHVTKERMNYKRRIFRGCGGFDAGKWHANFENVALSYCFRLPLTKFNFHIKNLHHFPICHACHVLVMMRVLTAGMCGA
jgi:hypothetical protein